MPRPEDLSDWPGRATAAAQAVTRNFGQRLLFLPRTHIAAIVRPSTGLQNLTGPWHYWWQAQYVDCLVDTGFRELADSFAFDGGRRPSAGKLASRLVTGIWLRNFLRFTNNYYDDMAWLALATQRLQTLAEKTRNPGRRRNARLQQSLHLQFDSACTADLGGGTFWSTRRDFKNTPATAPVALHYARTGHHAKAQALVDWLDARLFDPAKGLYLDGIRIRDGQAVLEDAIYTYNQGPILGALLELGGPGNLARAAGVVDAVARHLTVSPPDRPGVPDSPGASGSDRLLRSEMVLRCEGSGDGGLFSGILARYLALVANDLRLPEDTRAAARRLVLDTAEAFWAGRTSRPGRASREAPDGGWLFFSVRPHLPAAQTYPAGAAVELSTQLQAWMVLEAAATL